MGGDIYTNIAQSKAFINNTGQTYYAETSKALRDLQDGLKQRESSADKVDLSQLPQGLVNFIS